MRRLATSTFAVAAAIAALLYVSAWWPFRPHRASFQLAEGELLDESQAILISRAALRRAGLESPAMRPEPFAPSSPEHAGQPYAANAIRPEDSGYALWRDDSDLTWCYTVRLERADATILTTATRCK
jgi:hypothetical protein